MAEFAYVKHSVVSDGASPAYVDVLFEIMKKEKTGRAAKIHMF
jgi:hypothetical protein